MSVSVDIETTKPKALPFLVKQEAHFPNFWLNEPDTLWQARWKIQGPPAVFVFDRQGRRAGKFDAEDPDKVFSHEDIERLVKTLLANRSDPE